jgi:pimeloyl-ACP methyl ester carboxylesterase
MTDLTICVICPGFHAPNLTDRAIACLDLPVSIRTIVIPTDQIVPCDPVRIANYIERDLLTSGVIPEQLAPIKLNFLGFSAGTIGALGAAWLWRDRAQLGAIILCDGWGVPVLPVWDWFTDHQQPTIAPKIYRVSHDRWTHDTWSRMGIATPSFVADPEVEHLTLWRDLDRVQGCSINAAGQPIAPLSATDYIRQCLGCDETPANQ